MCHASAMDLARVDLNLLVALDRLLTHLSVTRAAASLGVGQPALSKTLEKLRDLFEDDLMIRSGHTMVRTPRANELHPKVRAALEAVDEALRPAAPFDPKTARGVVPLALGDDAQSALLVPLALALRREAPGLDLRVRGLNYDLPDLIERGTVHLAVVPDLQRLPGMPVPDLSRFVVKPLYRERFVVASRQPRRFSLKSFTAADHVLVAPTSTTELGFVDKLLADQGLSRRVALTVTTFHQAIEVVAQSDLIATLPARAVRMSLRKIHAARPPLRLPELDALMVWHPRSTTDARHRFARDLIKRVVSESETKPRAA